MARVGARSIRRPRSVPIERFRAASRLRGASRRDSLTDPEPRAIQALCRLRFQARTRDSISVGGETLRGWLLQDLPARPRRVDATYVSGDPLDGLQEAWPRLCCPKGSLGFETGGFCPARGTDAEVLRRMRVAADPGRRSRGPGPSQLAVQALRRREWPRLTPRVRVPAHRRNAVPVASRIRAPRRAIDCTPSYRRVAVAEVADRPSRIATTYARSDDRS